MLNNIRNYNSKQQRQTATVTPNTIYIAISREKTTVYWRCSPLDFHLRLDDTNACKYSDIITSLLLYSLAMSRSVSFLLSVPLQVWAYLCCFICWRKQLARNAYHNVQWKCKCRIMFAFCEVKIYIYTFEMASRKTNSYNERSKVLYKIDAKSESHRTISHNYIHIHSVFAVYLVLCDMYKWINLYK